MRALVEGGPGAGADLLVIETMMAMVEAEQAIRAAKAEGGGVPVLVMVTVDEAGNCLDGTTAEEAARWMGAWGADAVGCNCSEGPAIVLSVIERMRAVIAADAQCRHAQGGRRAKPVLDLTRVHGQLCAQVCPGRGDVYWRLLRNDAAAYPCHAGGVAGD